MTEFLLAIGCDHHLRISSSNNLALTWRNSIMKLLSFCFHKTSRSISTISLITNSNRAERGVGKKARQKVLIHRGVAISLLQVIPYSFNQSSFTRIAQIDFCWITDLNHQEKKRQTDLFPVHYEFFLLFWKQKKKKNCHTLWDFVTHSGITLGYLLEQVCELQY